jgi:hypothetical protein
MRGRSQIDITGLYGDISKFTNQHIAEISNESFITPFVEEKPVDSDPELGRISGETGDKPSLESKQSIISLTIGYIIRKIL